MPSEREDTIFYGQTDSEVHSAKLWRGARYQQVEGQIVPWFWPLRRVFKTAMKKGQQAAAGTLRALAEGGWWTPTRLKTVGVVAHDKCRCGKAAGTLWHKMGKCGRTAVEREIHCPRALLNAGDRNVWDPMYSRGVPAWPKTPKPPKARWWFQKLAEEAEYIAEGVVYTDGSAQGWYWKGCRAGYSAVCYSSEGKPMWVMWGVCGGKHTSIARAELEAVLKVLKITAGAVTIKVDNAMVVNGFKEGRKMCVRSGREGADLWRQAWAIMEDVGNGGSVEKVKAH